MSLEGSQPVERTEELILGKTKSRWHMADAACPEARVLSVGSFRVNVCSIRGWSCRRSAPRSWRD